MQPFYRKENGIKKPPVPAEFGITGYRGEFLVWFLFQKSLTIKQIISFPSTRVLPRAVLRSGD